jgi:protein-S-isoprenylcysteine O-methyltransferase Ste14
VQRLFVALRAGLYAGSFVLLWGWLASQVQIYDYHFRVEFPGWVIVAGIGIASLGAILSFLCVVMFIIHGRGTPAPFDAPRRFVAAGPYRYVRNPMYLGGFLVLLGTGLFLESVPIALLSAGFLLLFHVFVIFIEEPRLEERFGRTYHMYRMHVHRWVPGFTPFVSRE